ncbi:glycosyltransferase family 2 protein [Sporosarcina sp. BI001-red]|uniref:glycosyltransferase family 2 protein n=1 Tax=Sporosarcina sp. BI001-red TaxID=2282866 RepID=UPI0013146F97|nr:glycosyltransferase family 2 protein [Sporosarcina sp. BI001-red]
MVEYSVIVPIFNEEAYVKEFLLNIERQTLGKEKFEVILIDGLSTDRTREEIEKITDQLTFELILIENRRRIIPAALNIGCRNARGHMIIRLDVHSNFKETYLEQLITTFHLHADCCNVGGRTIATGYNTMSNHIAFTLNTPFGIGGAKFRYSLEMAEVDSVFPGIFRKQELDAAGGWNEDWVINEDAELNYRLKQHTGKLIKLIPDDGIQIEYYPRSTIQAFARQFFRYGIWRNKTNVRHPDSMRISHLIPPAFAVAIMGVLPLIFVNLYLVTFPLLLLTVYVGMIRKAVGKKVPEGLAFTKLLVVFLVLHLSWGAGTLKGYVISGVPMKGIAQVFIRNFEKMFKVIQRA